MPKIMYPAQRPRRRWLRWSLAYAAGVLGLMVIGLVVETEVSPGPRQPATFTASVPTPPWASSAAPAAKIRPSGRPRPTTPIGPPPLSGPLTLATGRETVNGVEVGFPQSTVGAVSAAADATGEVFSTLDPDRAAAVMRMTAAPSYANAPQQAAQGAASDRRTLGIPATGPVPPGYSLLVQPVMYQARDVTASSVTVLLLCDLTTTQPGQGTQTEVGVFPVQVTWTDSDWKIASFGTGSDTGLAAEPFSPQAAALGWQELLPQETTAYVSELPDRPAPVHKQRSERDSR